MRDYIIFKFLIGLNKMSKKTVLIITDGIGHNSSCNFNAFCNAKKPTYDYLFSNVPYSLIHTYGEYVGLPDNQMGNSEVGHMTIGSGRVLYQDLVKIHLAIKNDSKKLNFKTNELKDKQKIYENQIKASEQALIDFPELRTNILKRKNQLLQDIEKLKAYTDFLTSLI